MRPLGKKTHYRREGKSKLKHRAVMERKLGRALLPAELVHHEDKNTENNADANLQVMSHLEHVRHHHLKHPLTKVCVVCGKTFPTVRGRRGRQRACGRACRNILIGRSLARLTPAQIAAIRAQRAAGAKLTEIAARVGCSQSMVSQVARGLARTRG